MSLVYCQPLTTFVCIHYVLLIAFFFSLMTTHSYYILVCKCVCVFACHYVRSMHKNTSKMRPRECGGPLRGCGGAGSVATSSAEAARGPLRRFAAPVCSRSTHSGRWTFGPRPSSAPSRTRPRECGGPLRGCGGAGSVATSSAEAVRGPLRRFAAPVCSRNTHSGRWNFGPRPSSAPSRTRPRERGGPLRGCGGAGSVATSSAEAVRGPLRRFAAPVCSRSTHSGRWTFGPRPSSAPPCSCCAMLAIVVPSMSSTKFSIESAPVCSRSTHSGRWTFGPRPSSAPPCSCCAMLAIVVPSMSSTRFSIESTPVIQGSSTSCTSTQSLLLVYFCLQRFKRTYVYHFVVESEAA
jgi:hypothetical protein